jgi:hypothetical protein
MHCAQTASAAKLMLVKAGLVAASAVLVAGCLPVGQSRSTASSSGSASPPANQPRTAASVPDSPMSLLRASFDALAEQPGQPVMAMAYAADAGNTGLASRDDFPFKLRGTATTRTTSIDMRPARALPHSAPFPRPAPSLGDRPIAGDSATRLASLSPAGMIPAEVVTVSPRAPTAADIEALVTAKAEQHGVPVNLAHAVVRVESNYNPHVTGRGATIGLMQIKYSTARSMGYKGTVRELFDPAVNVEWGMRYLAGARKIAKGDICGTVLRYQYGHYAVRRTNTSARYCGKVQAYMKAAPATRKLAGLPAR